MEIILKGKAGNEKVRIKCEHCEAILEAERKELKLLKACSDYKLFEVKCPCCNHGCLIRDIDLK